LPSDERQKALLKLTAKRGLLFAANQTFLPLSPTRYLVFSLSLSLSLFVSFSIIFSSTFGCNKEADKMAVILIFKSVDHIKKEKKNILDFQIERRFSNQLFTKSTKAASSVDLRPSSLLSFRNVFLSSRSFLYPSHYFHFSIVTRSFCFSLEPFETSTFTSGPLLSVSILDHFARLSLSLPLALSFPLS
jgi:hypothetical protein